MREEGGGHNPLHGHWLKLRSTSEPARQGFGFDLYLLPLPAPRCEPGRSFCEPVMAVGWEFCPDHATFCESLEAYSARIFRLVSQDRDDRAGRDWSARYGGGVMLMWRTAPSTSFTASDGPCRCSAPSIKPMSSCADSSALFAISMPMNRPKRSISSCGIGTSSTVGFLSIERRAPSSIGASWTDRSPAIRYDASVHSLWSLTHA